MKKFLLSLFILFAATTLQAQPIITQNPQNTTACADTCAVMTIAANGASLTYFWYESISGGADVLVDVGVSMQLCDSIIQYDGSMFYCVVKNLNGDSAVSNMAQLTVDSCVAPVADFDWSWNWEMKEVCFESTSSHAETVIWLFGDGSTDASNTDSLCRFYDEYELYYVKLQVFNDYGQDEITKAIDFLGMNETSTNVTIAPNPMTDHVFIRTERPLDLVELYDIQGRMVLHQTSMNSTARLDVSTLQPGVYMLHAKAGDDLIQRTLIKP